MRKLIGLGLFLLMAAGAAAAELTETIDKTFDVRPGANVTLTNVNGRITVSAWDQPRVRVIAVKRVEADKDDVQAAMKELRVDMTPRNGGLVITTKQPEESEGLNGIFAWLTGDRVEASVKYELTVPRTMNLDIENTNGHIVAKNVNGKLALETTNGGIDVIGCGGTLEASTTNGGIDAELTSVTKGQPLSFETTNGRIEVTLPSTLAVDVDADTTNGSIKTDLPIATKSTDRNSLRGAINGGGTPLRLRTTNGGIAIRAH